jgi:hypothetical protein
MKITKPKDEEIPEFYREYIAECTEDDLIKSLELGLDDILSLIGTIKPEQENFKYAEGKWSVKEVISHMIDGERVFSYRALRFSRMDNTPLAGFDENLYVPNSNAGVRSMLSLQKEFETLRLSNIELFSGMTKDMLDFAGNANGLKISARTNGWIIAGHAKHHCKVLREKYLK